MGENADLERRALEAMLHYRKALAKVEELEHEEALAHRALIEWRGRIERSSSDPVASITRANLLGAGHEAISRLHNVRLAMSEATAELKSAFTTLVAFDDALGYLPIPEAIDSKTKEAGDSPEE